MMRIQYHLKPADRGHDRQLFDDDNVRASHNLETAHPSLALQTSRRRTNQPIKVEGSVLFRMIRWSFVLFRNMRRRKKNKL